MKKLCCVVVCVFTFFGCSVCKDYEETVLQYGQMIVDYNKAYISKDMSLTEDDKAIMLKSCEEYLRLLNKK